MFRYFYLLLLCREEGDDDQLLGDYLMTLEGEIHQKTDILCKMPRVLCRLRNMMCALFSGSQSGQS